MSYSVPQVGRGIVEVLLPTFADLGTTNRDHPDWVIVAKVVNLTL